MIKKLPLIVSITFLSLCAAAQQLQEPFLQWQKLYGGSNSDGASSVIQTTDGGYIVAGNTASNDRNVSGNHGENDVWIIKLNNAGNLLWQKTYGGSANDYASSIIQTNDGGYIVAGQTASNDGDVSGNHGGGGDAWVLKLDVMGNIQWQKTYGGSGFDDAKAIQQINGGGYIIAGSTGSTDGDVTNNHGGGDDWIIKINANGNILWQKTYGGSDGEVANSIQQTTDGGYIVAGITLSNDGDVTGNHGGFDYWILKLSVTGKIQWERAYGGSYFDYATNIQQTSGGGYIVAGYSDSFDGDVTGHHPGIASYTDYWIVRLTPEGNITWEKSLGGSFDDQPYKVLQTNDGNFVVAGWAYYADGDIHHSHGLNDFWLVDLDRSGNINWEKTYGLRRFDQAYAMAQTNDNGFILAGWAGDEEGGKPAVNRGASDYEIMKLSSDILNDEIKITGVTITPNCSQHNSVTCKTNNGADTILLYRYDSLIRGEITNTQTITFNNLQPGTYYAAEIKNGVTYTSTSVDLIPVPNNISVSNINSNSAQINWQLLECADYYTIKYKQQGTESWTQKITADNATNYSLSNLTPSTTYVVKVASNKEKFNVTGASKFSDSIVFTTSSAFVANNDAYAKTNIGLIQLSVSPNPARNNFKISFASAETKKVNAILYDVNAKAVLSTGLINANTLNGKQVNTSQFAKGIFYLKLMNENGEIIGSTKIVIAK